MCRLNSEDDYYSDFSDYHSTGAMATEEHLKFVEAAADDHFDDQALLKLALTAAGAELNKPNGNRSLAQIGVGAVGFVVTLAGLEVNAASSKRPA